MARRREGIVHESISQLETLAARYQGRIEESRLNMLLAFRKNPTATTREVAARIRYSEKTVQRWWNIYLGGGLPLLLQDAPLRAKGDNQPRVYYENARSIPPAVREFLNGLPTTGRTVEWMRGVRNGLRKLLADVDRIVIDINLHCDPNDPAAEEELMITQHVQPAPLPRGGRPDVVTTWNARSPSQNIIEQAGRHGFDPRRFHEPHCFEYYLQGRSYLGTIILWRERTMPPISQATLEIMRSIEPFMSFLLSDCVARCQKHDPDLHLFKEVVDAIGGRIGLTRRQEEVFLHQVFGKSQEEIAASLNIALGTVRKHITAIHQKSGTHSHGELFARFFTPLRDD
jgi:DNA-binding CsgD family transcriptional regulator